MAQVFDLTSPNRDFLGIQSEPCILHSLEERTHVCRVLLHRTRINDEVLMLAKHESSLQISEQLVHNTGQDLTAYTDPHGWSIEFEEAMGVQKAVTRRL